MELLTTLIITIIAATLSANLAVGRFKKERAWEKKEEAYSLLIKGTRASIEYSETFIDNSYSCYSEAKQEELASLHKIRYESIKDVEKIMHGHYLFMTEQEVSTVQSFIKGLHWPDEMDSRDMAEHDLEHHQQLLSEIEVNAKESLHIEQSNFYLTLSRLWKMFDNLFKPAAKWLNNK